MLNWTLSVIITANQCTVCPGNLISSARLHIRRTTLWFHLHQITFSRFSQASRRDYFKLTGQVCFIKNVFNKHKAAHSPLIASKRWNHVDLIEGKTPKSNILILKVQNDSFTAVCLGSAALFHLELQINTLTQFPLSLSNLIKVLSVLIIQ